jgi:drug/metabolite transporter (DMT)-like permease
MGTSKARVLALAEAFLVTFLWSTSYILIKIGFEEINPLAFASYRYFLASFF